MRLVRLIDERLVGERLVGERLVGEILVEDRLPRERENVKAFFGPPSETEGRDELEGLGLNTVPLNMGISESGSKNPFASSFANLLLIRGSIVQAV